MTTLKEISIFDIEGFHYGNAQSIEGGTGCTVIIPENGATCGIDIRGGGPASREIGLLDPLAANDCVNAVLLSGGSAFGLNSASGVMQYLEERNIGFPTADGVVPIVCASCIYDLGFASSKVRPDHTMAYEACLNAEKNQYQDGNYGCGTGATVGKALGPSHMMKGGIGSFAYQCGDLKVGAIVAVNAFGDIFDLATNTKIAGSLDYDTNTFLSSEDALYTNHVQASKHTNTTIGIIITNGNFNKTQCTKIAGMAHDGMARAINPIHTEFDGDSIYVMSKGDVDADINVTGTLASRVFANAIKNAIISAEDLHGIKSYQSLH